MTDATGSKKGSKKPSEERGTNLTPKSGVKALSTCYITFQRQIKQLKKKWDRELGASRGETK